MKDLQVSQSFDNTNGAYSLVLNTYETIDFPIYGELAFVIAPPTGNTGVLYFEYDWPLIKYITQLTSQMFNLLKY